MPGAAWQFDADVAQVFDDMLQRSIPQYDVMRRTVFELACAYVKDDCAIVDLGCARGEALAPFVQKFGAYNTYVGIDVSEPMLDAARERPAHVLPARPRLRHTLRADTPVYADRASPAHPT
jgi:tRNA (cmo5U34)-methyltransferase